MENLPIVLDQKKILESLDRARGWVQRLPKENGAFHGVFIWHDGEAIRSLLAAYRRTRDAALLEPCRKAADFVLSLQYLDAGNEKYYGCYETPCYTPQQKIAPSDIFELLPGLLELYTETKEEKYLKSAGLAADWLIKHASFERKGVMGQLFDAARWEVINPLPIHDEAAFLRLWEATGKTDYLEVFRDQVEVLVSSQDLNGRWHWNSGLRSFRAAGRSVYWFTYPLLAHYRKFGETRLLPPLVRACDNLVRMQLWDGSIPAFQNTDGSTLAPGARSGDHFPPFRGESGICGTATAMAAILWTDLYRIAGDPNYRWAAVRALKWILDHQIGDGKDAGAYLHSYYFDPGTNEWKVSLRDISTFYGIMAFENYLLD